MLQKTWYMLGRFIVDQYLKHVMKADVSNEATLPAGPKIIVANHPSTSDPAFVTTLIPEQATILILETLFQVPLFGRSLRMAGHIPVECGNGRAAMEKSLQLLKAGRTIIIFPEGAISPAEGGFQKMHTGAARLALMTGAPVVPVGIALDRKHLRLVHTNVKGKSEVGTWYLNGPYAMTVGDPINFTGNVEDREQVHAVTGQMRQHIQSLANRSACRLAARAARGARLGLPRRAFRRVNHFYTRSASLRLVQSSLLFLMLFTRHF